MSKQRETVKQWTSVKEKPIPLNMLDDIEVSYDGINPDDTVSFMEERTCMMAGIAGGYGYFGEGWGTNGNSQCDYGMICDEPEFWRYKTINK